MPDLAASTGLVRDQLGPATQDARAADEQQPHTDKRQDECPDSPAGCKRRCPKEAERDRQRAGYDETPEMVASFADNDPISTVTFVGIGIHLGKRMTPAGVEGRLNSLVRTS